MRHTRMNWPDRLSVPDPQYLAGIAADWLRPGGTTTGCSRPRTSQLISSYWVSVPLGWLGRCSRSLWWRFRALVIMPNAMQRSWRWYRGHEFPMFGSRGVQLMLRRQIDYGLSAILPIYSQDCIYYAWRSGEAGLDAAYPYSVEDIID